MRLGEHLDPTQEISLDTVKARAVHGVAVLTGRTFFLQVFGVVAFFLLTIILSVEQLGVWVIVSAVKNFLGYFSDIGLAAAIIQKKERVEQGELRTTFTVQQILVVLLIVILFALTPLFRSIYGLSQESVYLLWALGISLILSSLRSVPSALMERELQFGKLVIPQMGEMLLFHGLTVTLAFAGLGITSFTVAVLVSGVVGLVLTYYVRPWKPSFSFERRDRRALLGLLRFGLPYQANSFLAVLKDDGMTLVLGGIIGPAGVSFVGWAQKWANAPLRFFMDSVIKVSFPAFSRMQHDKHELSNAVSRTIFFISLLVFPGIVGIVLVAPPLTEIIPKYEKWQPALVALALIGINAGFAAVTTPLTNMLSAIGKINITFKLMVMWTALTLMLLPLLAARYNVNGVALGFALVGTSSIVAIFWAKRFVDIDFIGSVFIPLIASFGMGIVMFLIGNIIPIGVVGVITMIVLGILTYLGILYVFLGKELRVDIKTLYATFKKQS